MMPRDGEQMATASDAGELVDKAGAPRDAMWTSYAAILLSLVIAGALSTGRLVESAERLPFGPLHDRVVAAASTADDLARRAGLDRPSTWAEVARAGAVRAEPMVADGARRAMERIATVVPSTLPSIGSGPPVLIARSVGKEMRSGGIIGLLTRDEEDRGGDAASDAVPIPESPLDGVAPSSPGAELLDGREAGAQTESAQETSGSEADPGADGDKSQGAEPAVRNRSLAEAEAGAKGEWTPPPSDRDRRAGSSNESRASAVARDLSRIAASVPTPRVFDERDPLRVHVAGDSMAQPLGYALQRAVVDDPRVVVTLDFHISTGLVRPDYFDWPERIEETLDPSAGPPGRPLPEVIVFFVGGNENQNMRVGIREVLMVGTPEWAEVYGQRAAKVMDLAGKGGARVVWVGMPVVRDPEFNEAARGMNSSVAAAADARPWVNFVDIWTLFAGPDGGFSPFLPGARGDLGQMREEDGIHLSGEGTNLLAEQVFTMLGGVWDLRTPTPTATATANRERYADGDQHGSAHGNSDSVGYPRLHQRLRLFVGPGYPREQRRRSRRGRSRRHR